MQQLTYINLRGERAVFGRGAPYLLRSVRGVGACDNALTLTEDGARDGGRLLSLRREAREITAVIQILGATRQGLYESREALCRVLSPDLAADGESRAQILSLLGLDDTELAQSAGNYIWRNLYGETSTGRTQLASSIWLKEGVPYNEETLATLAQQYLASTFSAPMGEKKTDSAIAEWINENTGGLLRDASGSIETKPETVMMLLSTLYFKDQWRDEFWEKETKKDTFTAADGAQQTVDFMHLTQDRADYCRGENFTVAQLSFRGGQTMRFLLPDEGTTLERLLADDTVVGGLMIYDMGVSLPSGKLIWSVPKFDVSSDLELTDALKALGVTDVFDFDKSDFSPLIDEEKFDESVAVMRVQHAARVKIDEKGCEAAAFTAVRGDAQSAAPEDLPVVEMNLNRPFAFMITGVDGLPLFLGTVNSL